MFTSEQLLFVAGTITLTITLIYLSNFVWRLERKNDIKCFAIGDIIFMIFMFLLRFSPADQVPSLISSLLVAELTLALVWVELSKRPELKLGNFVPIIHEEHTTGLAYKAGFHDEEPEPSRFLKIREVSYENLKFDEHFSFSVDLSNIGYGEIMVHDYTLYIDGKRQKPIPLGKPPYNERLRLVTQERHPIDMPSLYIKSAGFHRIHVTFSGMTTKCSKEIWFSISEDFKKLRYIEMLPYNRLLSPLIKAKLKNCKRVI